ncbi:hypothetical protein AGMMS49543_25920 [Betaproteobacteria bacterium]|nr:hypothetical protein AGMMS49543_25920 [Betaproteobacteria bacterium]GHU09543.1 hypothetical protein AGMMS50225_10600 [Betaproteobacteria bacterium]GHU16402.1 hypothetical protein AGMMS50243_02400 [Betaproteobacteria bacterium]
MSNNPKTKLELTWPGKENRPRLEPRILLVPDTAIQLGRSIAALQVEFTQHNP